MKGPYALLLLFFLLAPTVKAQTPRTVHLFTCQDELSSADGKFILEELLRLDQEARISLDGPMLKIKLQEPRNVQRVAEAVMRSGRCVPSAHKSISASVDPGEVGLPTFKSTGNAEHDDAGYQAAKAAWIAADPKRYEALTTPTMDLDPNAQ